MSSPLDGSAPLGPGPTGRTAQDARARAVGFAGSAFLHALVLLPFLVAGQQGLQASRGGATFIPVEVRAVGEGVAAPRAAMSKRQAAQETPSVPMLVGKAPAAEVPQAASDADPLTAKLQALAALRQPDASDAADASGAAMPAESDGAAFGLDNMYQVRDFLRAQVIRRWHLDVTSLGTHRGPVPIRVQVTAQGDVVKAEIVRSAFSTADPIDEEIAVSARNAVLLASPFHMPPGRYQGVMEVVLDLDPNAVVR